MKIGNKDIEKSRYRGFGTKKDVRESNIAVFQSLKRRESSVKCCRDFNKNKERISEYTKHLEI